MPSNSSFDRQQPLSITANIKVLHGGIAQVEGFMVAPQEADVIWDTLCDYSKLPKYTINTVSCTALSEPALQSQPFISSGHAGKEHGDEVVVLRQVNRIRFLNLFGGDFTTHFTATRSNSNRTLTLALQDSDLFKVCHTTYTVRSNPHNRIGWCSVSYSNTALLHKMPPWPFRKFYYAMVKQGVHQILMSLAAVAAGQEVAAPLCDADVVIAE